MPENWKWIWDHSGGAGGVDGEGAMAFIGTASDIIAYPPECRQFLARSRSPATRYLVSLDAGADDVKSTSPQRRRIIDDVSGRDRADRGAL